MKKRLAGMILVGSVVALFAFAASRNSAEDAKTVAALDTQYQAAVKNNDAETMNRILADDFELSLSSCQSTAWQKSSPKSTGRVSA